MRGTIRRRILVNFRVEPAIARRRLPVGFEPKLIDGYAVAGVCLIRLERERPSGIPVPIGFASENAAHRFAAYRNAELGPPEECVYIWRRHSDSLLNRTLGGRMFPGEHRPAFFAVHDDGRTIDFRMAARDGTSVRLRAQRALRLNAGSLFGSLEEAMLFFKSGALGYSAKQGDDRLDAVVLEAARWEVAPLEVDLVRSTYFEDTAMFPSGTVRFDSALLMTDVRHEWASAPSVRTHPYAPWSALGSCTDL